MKLQNFEILEKLGEGAYSSVYKVKRTIDQQNYALKKVQLSDLSLKEKENALNEVRIIASIRHPNVVSFKESFVSDDGDYLNLVMDYADDGDVLEKIKKHIKAGTRIRESYIWNIFIQSIKGLQELHNLNVYHRDIKSANLFLYKDGTTKIGDFNVSKQAKQGLLYTQTGTPYYASPEVWSDQPYTSSSDIWSIGCVLYELTTLNPPFNGETMRQLYQKIMSGNYKKISPKYSVELSQMISLLLQTDPKKRLSCQQLLKHPYVQKRMTEKHLISVQDDEKSILLKTIQFKQTPVSLQETLPSPNYQNLKVKKMIINEFLENNLSDESNSTSIFQPQSSITMKSPKDNDSSVSKQNASDIKQKKKQLKESLIPSLNEIKRKKTVQSEQHNIKKENSSKRIESLQNEIQLLEGKHIELISNKSKERSPSSHVKKQIVQEDTGQENKDSSLLESQSITRTQNQRGRSPGILRYKKLKLQDESSQEDKRSLNEQRSCHHIKDKDFNKQYNELNSGSLKRQNTRVNNHSQDQSLNGKKINLPILYQNKHFLSSSNSPPLSRIRQNCKQTQNYQLNIKFTQLIKLAQTRKILKDLYSSKIQDENKIKSLERQRKNNQIENVKSMKVMSSLNKSLDESDDIFSDKMFNSKGQRNERSQQQKQNELKRQIILPSINEDRKEDNLKNSSLFIGIEGNKQSDLQKHILDDEQQQQQQVKSYKRFNDLKQSNSQQKSSHNSQSPQRYKNEQYYLPSISKSSILQNIDNQVQQYSHKNVNKFRIPTSIVKQIELDEQSQSLNKNNKKQSQAHQNIETRPKTPPNLI